MNVYGSVNPSCVGTSMACGIEGGTSAGVVEWETYYTGADANQPADSTDHYNLIPAVGTGGTVYVEVYRAAGGLTCDGYSLSISS